MIVRHNNQLSLFQVSAGVPTHYKRSETKPVHYISFGNQGYKLLRHLHEQQFLGQLSVISQMVINTKYPINSYYINCQQKHEGYAKDPICLPDNFSAKLKSYNHHIVIVDLSKPYHQVLADAVISYLKLNGLSYHVIALCSVENDAHKQERLESFMVAHYNKYLTVLYNPTLTTHAAMPFSDYYKLQYNNVAQKCLELLKKL